MAFSIFNKTGPDGKSPATEPGKTTAKSSPRDSLGKSGSGAKTSFPATTPAPSVSARPASLAPTAGAPEMMAYGVEELPLLQEVAILYAADRLDAAQALLRKVVQDKTPQPQAWLMLLDLYKLRGMKKEFEDLAMTYIVKFERSPPTWNQQVNQPETRKETRSASDFFTFLAKDELSTEIKKLVEFAGRLGSVRIDVGKIKAVSPEDAGALANALRDFRKRELPVRFNNVNPFVELLKKSISENPSKDYGNVWGLLFELYQWLGMQKEFEDLGLEYAMGFETSPPSWEPVPVMGQSSDSEPGGDAESGAINGFPLRGSISLDNLGQMQQLLNHAAANKEVHINMAGLQRVDFSAAGVFVDTLSKLHAAEKKIVLVDINELVFPLLEAFGANRMAVLLRRKAQ